MTVVVAKNQQELQGVFDDIARAWRDVSFRRVLVNELEQLRIQHKKYFDTATGPDGVKWPPLKDATVIRKGHSVILVDKGRLRRDLVSEGTGVRIVIDEPARRGLTFGTDQEHSVFHDTAKGRRPARRHVGVDDAYVDGFGNRVIDHALEGLKNG